MNTHSKKFDRKTASILVVDDNPLNLLAIESILKPLRQPILLALSAHEALRLILQYHFAIILLDQQMPDIDGFETARLIRSREKSSHIPILFLSEWNQANTLGVKPSDDISSVNYIHQPVDPALLLSKMKICMDEYSINPSFQKAKPAESITNDRGRRA